MSSLSFKSSIKLLQRRPFSGYLTKEKGALSNKMVLFKSLPILTKSLV